MHIVQILPELNQGGVERYVIDLNKFLIKSGYKSSIISNGGIYEDLITKNGGNHYRIDTCSKNIFNFYDRAIKLNLLINKIEPQIIHIHSRVPAWIAQLSIKKNLIPCVSTVHGFNSINLYSKIMTKADRIISVSNPLKKYLISNYATDPNKIIVIPNGISSEDFNPYNVNHEWIKKFKSNYKLNNKKIITKIGRLSPIKGYEKFIKIMVKVHENDSSFSGIIVGSSSKNNKYEIKIKKLVKNLNAQSYIHFVGNQTMMAEIYYLSDCIVSTTIKPESFGRSLVESLMMGTPVIAASQGGPLDIIDDKKNGFLYSPDQLENIYDLLINKSFLNLKIQRSNIIDNFDNNIVGSKIIKIYNEILSNK